MLRRIKAPTVLLLALAVTAVLHFALRLAAGDDPTEGGTAITGAVALALSWIAALALLRDRSVEDANARDEGKGDES